MVLLQVLLQEGENAPKPAEQLATFALAQVTTNRLHKDRCCSLSLITYSLEVGEGSHYDFFELEVHSQVSKIVVITNRSFSVKQQLPATSFLLPFSIDHRKLTPQRKDSLPGLCFLKLAC